MLRLITPAQKLTLPEGLTLTQSNRKYENILLMQCSAGSIELADLRQGDFKILGLRMNKEQQQQAYTIARAVRDGQVGRLDGARRLHQELGLNLSSAQFLIYVYLHMCEGAAYKRALSSSDLDFFLGQIRIEEGNQMLAKALTALRGHIAYREGTGVSQRSNRAILQKYEKLSEITNLRVDDDEFIGIPFYIESDGSKTLFLPQLKHKEGFQVGSNGSEQKFSDYWAALGALKAMANPTFWRESTENARAAVVCETSQVEEVKRRYIEDQLNRM